MKIFREFRAGEVKVLLYRLFLAYFFYQVMRLLFWFFNRSLIPVGGVREYLSLAYHGLAFDTTAILYVNTLFILLSLLPIPATTRSGYQKFLLWLYFITNGIAMAMNFSDFIYYKFSQARLSNTALSVARHEDNLLKVFGYSVLQHPAVPILFIICLALWLFLYKKVKVQYRKPRLKLPYYIWSVITLAVVALLTIGGIRGDFRHSTRPINLVDANKFVKNPLQANITLNSTFSFFRTLGTNHFKEVNYVDQKTIDQLVFPHKIYEREGGSPPNIVILIVESFGREYSGAFNEDRNIPGHISYTPFLDSLAAHSLIFPNAFANGRQSIHGMSSVLAGIPSLEDAFTSSPYANQPIQSIVSVCNEMGYDTSFYHGAPNGSMGFQGFANILGFKHYFGKTEYNNDADFDGIWAIWDEPFLQYFAKNTGKKQPFMTTVFTASSHDPFKIPEKYKGKFKPGPLQIHEPVQYTDYSIKKYFETASRQPWFQNTVFVITADHTNQIHYPEYQKTLNRSGVPLLFYSPNPAYGLRGVRNDIAQQADIYPTLADLIGYNKPIRSWGSSLLTPEKYPHLYVTSDGVQEFFIIKNYIYKFDGTEITGIYRLDDLNLDKNLKDELKTTETETGKLTVKAWYQDYMHRIINRKLK